MNPHDLALYKLKLKEMQRQLLEDIEGASDATKPVNLDQASVGRLSRMDAMQSQAMAQETQRRRQLQLTRIQAALDRMEEEDYGYCASCGEDIPLKRLEVDPAAPFCVTCAGKME